MAMVNDVNDVEGACCARVIFGGSERFWREIPLHLRFAFLMVILLALSTVLNEDSPQPKRENAN